MARLPEDMTLPEEMVAAVPDVPATPRDAATGSVATRRWPARWCVRRSGRPSRSVVCCLAGPDPHTVVGDVAGYTGDRAALEEPRRYDTRFFLAMLPKGQRADGATPEASGSGWQSPAGALADWRAHRAGLLPPTWMTLTELEECGSPAAALAAPRSIEKIIPRVVRDGGKLRVVLPGDPRYATADGHLEP